MARQVLPFAGAAVGFFLGGPTGAQIGFTIGAIVGNAVDPQTIQGPKIGEAALQTSAEGVFRPIVYGTGAVKGNVIVRGNRQVVTQRTQQGKGGGPVVEEQRVYWTFAIRIAEPVASITRIWQDEKLVYDVLPTSTILAESAEYAERFRFYDGSETQLPDPDLEAFQGIGNTSAYRGSAYVVFPNFDLTDRRESIPDFRFEVSNLVVTPYNYLALVHMDEKFTDTSIHLRDEIDPSRWTEGGDLVPETSPFGVNALLLNSPLDTASTTFDFATAIGTSPFCIACWGYLDGDSPGHVTDTILGHWFQPGTRSFQMNTRRTGLQNFFVQLSSDGTNITSIQGDTIVPHDEWVYYAITRDEFGTVRLFQGGIGETCELVGTGTFSGSLHSNTGEVPGENWVIGGFDNAPDENNWDGMLKELVIIVGDPVYTEAFPAPTAPWPNPESSGDPVSVPLSSIVSDLHDRADQDTSEYSVSELTDSVRGLVLSGDYTAADAIRTLMPIYKFDSAEYDGGSGYKIHYPKRGKPVVLTVTGDDLIEAAEKTVREDALERPRALHLHYENPDVGYAPAKATIRRSSPDVKVVGERSIQVPVAFKDVDEPAQIADRLMRIAWVEVGGEEEFTLPDNLLGLVPSDCIGVSLRNQVRRMRIVQQQIVGGRIRTVLLPDRQSAYTSNVTGVPVPAPTPPLPSIVGETVYRPLDIPALNDNDDRLIWYDAASGQTTAWYGAQTQHRAPADVEFTNSARFTQNTIMGTLLDDIPSASEHWPDTTNVVRIALFTDDVIEALTEQQFLSEGGAFALETASGWEVMQYRDVIDEGGGVFALSHLARGRLNTGGSAHTAGAIFVLLDGVLSVDAVTAYISQDLDHRAISFGMSPDGAEVITEEYTAQSQTEFPVAHLFGEIVGDDLNLMTVPRHRFGTEDNPVRSINWVEYRWTATDGVNSSSQSSITDTVTFDVTGWGSPITATVAQVNRFTGPGPIVTESF